MFLTSASDGDTAAVYLQLSFELKSVESENILTRKFICDRNVLMKIVKDNSLHFPVKIRFSTSNELTGSDKMRRTDENAIFNSRNIYGSD